MNKIIITYKNEKVTEYRFSLNKEKNMSIDEKLVLGEKNFSILAVLTEKGTCSLLVKDNKNIIFSTIFDANDKQGFGTVLFLKIVNDEYLQLDIR